MNARLFIKRNSATILSFVAVAGVVATAITSANATPKAVRALNTAKLNKGEEELTKIEKVKTVLVVYVRISAEENCVTSTKVREAMLNYWRKDHPELNTNDIFDEAIANTYRMTPPRIYKWEEMIFNREYTGDSFMESCDEDVISKDAMGNCLSTTIKTNGAVAVFLPGVAEHLAELLNSDFYMVFTSIHEVMIHNAKKVDPEDLKSVLTDTIRETVPEEDYLTSRIYKYNRRTHKFECVTD